MTTKCKGNCAECRPEHTARLKEEMEKPLEDAIFELKANYANRLAKAGFLFSEGTTVLTFGEIPDTKENRARVALSWIGMMIAMDHPLEGEMKSALDAEL